MCSSSDGNQETPPVTGGGNSSESIVNPIISATITNKYNSSIEVDNDSKTFTVFLTKNAGDGSDIKIKLQLDKDVSMYYPQTEEAEYNLVTKPEVWIAYNGSQVKYTIKREYIEKEDINPVSLGWKLTNDYNPLPEGITVYKSPAQLFDKNAIAYIAIVDMNVNTRKFKVLGSSESPSGKTPSRFYSETNSPIIINGGYFWYSSNTNKLHHIGLLLQEGKLNSGNATSSTRKDDKGQDAVFYPTRGVFTLSKSNSFACNWAYTLSDGFSTYAYPQPSNIKALTSPLPQPSKEYPANGWKLNTIEGIGAGPVLINNGTIYNTWEQEIWDEIGGINPTHGNVPRSAIGVTENKKLILLAAEGRNITPGVSGFSTEEIAKILLSLGCVDAINLDGGGSSCMLINGKETIKPSGNSIQRAVVTAIAIE